MRPVPPEFEEFVRHRRAGLVATATLLLGDQGRAEDAVQETLVRVAERWEQATRDGTPGAMRTPRWCAGASTPVGGGSAGPSGRSSTCLRFPVRQAMSIDRCCCGPRCCA